MIKQNPFSVYDFLGYLIPGSIAIYSFLIIDYLKKYNDYSIEGFAKCLGEFKFEGIFFFIIISYILGHLLSFASSITIEKYANWSYGYPSKYLLNMKHKGYWKSANKWRDYFWRITLVIILIPCVIFDKILGQILGFKMFYQRGLDKLLRKLIVYKINTLFTEIGFGEVENYEDFDNGKGNSHDFHRVVTHYAYEHSKQHQAKMSNYVALYGFLRTLCLIFNLLAIYLFTRTLLYLEINFLNISSIIILSALSYLSFMAFMKFYRRYTLEGFMVITVDKNLG